MNVSIPLCGKLIGSYLASIVLLSAIGWGFWTTDSLLRSLADEFYEKTYAGMDGTLHGLANLVHAEAAQSTANQPVPKEVIRRDLDDLLRSIDGVINSTTTAKARSEEHT